MAITYFDKRYLLIGSVAVGGMIAYYCMTTRKKPIKINKPPENKPVDTICKDLGVGVQFDVFYGPADTSQCVKESDTYTDNQQPQKLNDIHKIDTCTNVILTTNSSSNLQDAGTQKIDTVSNVILKVLEDLELNQPYIHSTQPVEKYSNDHQSDDPIILMAMSDL